MTTAPVPSTPRAVWIGFALVFGVLVGTAAGVLSAAGGVPVPLAVVAGEARLRSRSACSSPWSATPPTTGRRCGLGRSMVFMSSTVGTRRGRAILSAEVGNGCACGRDRPADRQRRHARRISIFGVDVARAVGARGRRAGKCAGQARDGVGIGLTTGQGTPGTDRAARRRCTR